MTGYLGGDYRDGEILVDHEHFLKVVISFWGINNFFQNFLFIILNILA